MKYSQEEIDKMKELGYSYSTAFDGVFIKLEPMEPETVKESSNKYTTLPNVP